MALIDATKGFLEKVSKMDISGQTGELLWKHPNPLIVSGSSLIVGESQEAIFVKSGQIEEVFTAGRYTISSETMPFLANLINLPFGKRSPYLAEVWFVNKAVQLDVKWGTPIPLEMEDPKYNVMVSLRANGSISLRVSNARNLFVNITGQVSSFTMEQLRIKTKSIVNSRLVEVLSKYSLSSGKSFTEMRGSTTEIGILMKDALQSEFELYGLEVCGCYVLVDPVKNDAYNAAIERATKLRVAQTEADVKATIEMKNIELQRLRMEQLGYTYEQDRQYDVLETAAGNTGEGGLAAAAIGLGVGVNVGGKIGAKLADMVSPPTTVSRPTPAASLKCNSCGYVVEQGSPKFCPECGASMQRRCSKCDSVIDGNPKYCPECGAPTQQRCSECNSVIEGNPKFCPECGKQQ